MNRKKYWTGLTLWLLHASVTVSAQAPDTLQRQLDEVTITANRSPESLGEVGRSVTVLDRNALAKSTCTTLGELLVQQAGIYLVGAGQTPGANQTLFLRGTNSNQTAIYLDGVRISDVSSVNGVADLSELPLASLDRVEILRGAHSTVYGASAVGGVILLESRVPERDGWNLQLGSGGGIFRKSGNQWDASLSSAYRWKSGWWLAADADRLSVNGLDATVDTTSGGSPITRDRDDWLKQNVSFAFGKQTSKGSTSIRYRFTNTATDIDRTAFTDDDNYRLDYRRHLIGLQGNRVFGKWHIGYSGGWSSTERKSLNDSSRVDQSGNFDGTYVDDRYQGQQINGDVFAHFNGPQWSLLAGLNGLHESMKQEHYFFSRAFGFISESRTDMDTLDPKATQFAPYLQVRLQGGLLSSALEPFSLVAGVRQVNHSLFGSILTYEINPSWKVDDNSLLFASFSTGYNAPSLYQLFAPETYSPWDGTSVVPLTRGNSDLTPEYSRSMEFGIRQQTDKSQIRFSVFRNRTDDIIDYVYLWNGNVPVDSLGTDLNRDDFRGDRYVNIGDQVAYGAELSFRTALGSRLSALATASLVDGYLDLRPTGKDAATSGYTMQAFSNGAFLIAGERMRGLIRRPNTMSAGLELQATRNCVVTARMQYVGARNDNYYEPLYGPYGALGRRAVNDYTLLDLNVSWSVTDRFRLNGRIENLFDTRYEEIMGFTSRGRGLYIRLTYTLKGDQ